MLIKYSPMFEPVRYEAPDGAPAVGDVLDDGGQYYYVVTKVRWVNTSTFWRRRWERLVEVVEHDRADEMGM